MTPQSPLAASLTAMLEKVGVSGNAHVEEVNCPTHGVSLGVVRDGKPATCYQCAEIAQDAAYRLKLAEDELSARLAACNIPARYAKTLVKDWVIETEQQQAVIHIVKGWFATLPHNTGQGLMLGGTTGTGKTMLMSAILRRVISKLGKTARYTTARRLIASIKDTYGGGKVTESEMIAKYVDLDVLAIDEIDVINASAADICLLFEVIDQRGNAMRPTLFASNSTPLQLEDTLGVRIVDRLLFGAAVVWMDWPSLRGGRNGY